MEDWFVTEELYCCSNADSKITQKLLQPKNLSCNIDHAMIFRFCSTTDHILLARIPSNQRRAKYTLKPDTNRRESGQEAQLESAKVFKHRFAVAE